MTEEYAQEKVFEAYSTYVRILIDFATKLAENQVPAPSELCTALSTNPENYI